MKRSLPFAVVLATALALPVLAADKPAAPPAAAGAFSTKPLESTTTGTVTVEGRRISYKAVAGTLILKDKNGKPAASMFYVAYFKDGVKHESGRPVTFFYNGGPGSSTVWLHMGAFGPRRVVTADHTHTPPAPYRLVNNDYSLLDATDEVFVDAVGTGFSRILGKGQGGAGTPKEFYGVDADGKSFAQFITQFLSRYGRWNSPK
ncbi:MAG: S10 family serine carboxypeptidase-like protein, partial [Gammaproteobacteria bacterium]